MIKIVIITNKLYTTTSHLSIHQISFCRGKIIIKHYIYISYANFKNQIQCFLQVNDALEKIVRVGLGG